jgi:hypothetical protein
MAKANGTRGLIAVDKMGMVLFLDPATYETQVVLDGFPRTVHELLVVPETELAYVPIFGDGVQGEIPIRRPGRRRTVHRRRWKSSFAAGKGCESLGFY